MTREFVQVVITAPTRELANQIHQEVLKITKFLGPDEATIYVLEFLKDGPSLIIN